MSDIIALAKKKYELEMKKKEQDAALKKTTGELASLDDELYNAMWREDMQSIHINGQLIYLSVQQKASIPPDFQEEFYQALAEHDLGHLLKTSIHANTLNSFIKEQIEENNGLPEWLSEFVNVYQKNNVNMKKAAK